MKSPFIVLFLICLLAGSSASSQTKPTLKSGDFLFLDLDCGPLCDAIESVTQSHGGRRFSHVGLVYLKQDSVFVVEAIGRSVRLTWLPVFLRYSGKPAVLGRLKPKYQPLIPEALSFALSKLGFPYDDEFRMNNGKYYCSELLYDAFLAANQGKPVFALAPMTYKQPDTHQILPAWEAYFSKIGVRIPEGEPGCNPGGISMFKGMKILGELP